MGIIAEKINYEQMVIDQLREYKSLVGRIKVIERYPIGFGMYVTSTNAEDKLQDLHKMLKGLPSYMYLNKREQAIETAANAYLTQFPLGTKSQAWEVKSKRPMDDEDKKLLNELKRKIEKVIEARGGTAEGFEGVLKRLNELQGLQDRVEMICHIIEAMDDYKPNYARLLRLRYMDGNTVEEVIAQMNISRATFDRWRPKAINEYSILIGMRQS